MKKKFLSYLLLTLIVTNNVINVYAINNENTDNKPNINTNINNNNKPDNANMNDNIKFMKINDTVTIDNDINITLYLDNIPYDNFTFKMYSSNSLEDVNAKDIELKNFNNEEISFDYCINCSTLKTISLNYKLPTTINIGDKITINAQIINKDSTEEIKEFKEYRKIVTVIDSIKEDKEDNVKENDKEKEKNIMNNNNFSNKSNISFSNNVSSTNKSNTQTKYNGSSNNYLSNITIKGYSLNKSFVKERLTYFVTVPNNVTSVNISASKESSKASLSISGSSNLSVGLNKVLIKVTSEDGRVKNYRIYVTRLDSDKDEG